MLAINSTRLCRIVESVLGNGSTVSGPMIYAQVYNYMRADLQITTCHWNGTAITGEVYAFPAINVRVQNILLLLSFAEDSYERSL